MHLVVLSNFYFKMLIKNKNFYYCAQILTQLIVLLIVHHWFIFIGLLLKFACSLRSQLAMRNYKLLKASVISPFYIIWKTAGWQLLHSQMIFYAFTTNAMSLAAAVCTITMFYVPCLIAFHMPGLFNICL